MSITFAIPGDTVLGIGMGNTELPKIALVQGRRLELYRVDGINTEGSMKCVDNAFLQSYNSGNLQVGRHDRVSCTSIGPSTKPIAV